MSEFTPVPHKSLKKIQTLCYCLPMKVYHLC